MVHFLEEGGGLPSSPPLPRPLAFSLAWRQRRIRIDAPRLLLLPLLLLLLVLSATQKPICPPPLPSKSGGGRPCLSGNACFDYEG